MDEAQMMQMMQAQGAPQGLPQGPPPQQGMPAGLEGLDPQILELLMQLLQSGQLGGMPPAEQPEAPVEAPPYVEGGKLRLDEPQRQGAPQGGMSEEDAALMALLGGGPVG